MKIKLSLLAGLLALGSFAVKAQKYGATPEDSVNCKQNISLYQDYYKQKLHDDALTYIKEVCKICPKASKAAWQKGAKIYQAKAKASKKDPAQMNLYVDSLMAMYDGRIEHFGQKGKVLEMKGKDHLKFRKKQPEVAYAMFEEAYQLRGNKMGSSGIVYMFKSKYDMFKQGKCEKTEVIELYPKLKEVADFNIKHSKIEKRKAAYVTANENLLQIFKEVASCEDLETAFKPRFEAKPDDLETVKGILELLNAKECTDSDFYIAVAKKAQELEPSALAAYSIGKWYAKKGKCSEAVNFYKQAFEMAESLSEEEIKPFKIKAGLSAASCQLANKNYADCKNFALRVIKVDPNNGDAYMLIGDAYFYAGNKGAEDACRKKANYWAAVDKYNVAAAKNPELKTKAGQKIAKAKAQYPEKNECFFVSIQEGQKITIGGWIGETVTVRF